MDLDAKTAAQVLSELADITTPRRRERGEA